jgi:hypothetical protein
MELEPLQMSKMSSFAPPARGLTPIMLTYPPTRTICSFLPSILSILDGKPMYANFKDITPTTESTVISLSNLLKPNSKVNHNLATEKDLRKLSILPNNTRKSIAQPTKSLTVSSQKTLTGGMLVVITS